MEQGFNQKILKNTVFLFGARISSMMIVVLLTPYMLRKLGTTEYGIWVLVAAFISYTGLLDLGVGTSFVKYVAEYEARGDQEGVNGVLSAGVIFYLALAPVVLAVVLPASGLILGLLNVPELLQEKARFVLNLGIIAFLFSNIVLVYQCIIVGLQRMDVSSAINAALSACYALGCVSVLWMGFGIRGLAVVQLLIQSIAALVSIYFAHRLYPSLKFDLRIVKKYFLTLLRYGMNLQISTFAGLVNFQYDKIIINRFIDATHVTFYEIGIRPPLTVRSFPLLFLSVLTPATSELEVRKGRAEVYDLYLRASKYTTIFAFPLFIGAAVMSKALIESWVGPGYDAAAMVLSIVSIGYLFNILAGPVSPLVQGLGRPDYQRNAEALSLVLNVILSLVLLLRYGLYGAALGTTIAMSLASVYYFWSFHRFMDRPILPFLGGTILKPALSAAASGLLAFSVSSALWSYLSPSRLTALFILVVSGSILVSTYALLLFKSRHLDDRDLALLRESRSFLVSKFR